MNVITRDPDITPTPARADGFTLSLRPSPPGEDKYGRTPENRLKVLLPALLRRYGFRVEKLETIPANKPTASTST